MKILQNSAGGPRKLINFRNLSTSEKYIVRNVSAASGVENLSGSENLVVHFLEQTYEFLYLGRRPQNLVVHFLIISCSEFLNLGRRTGWKLSYYNFFIDTPCMEPGPLTAAGKCDEVGIVGKP